MNQHRAIEIDPKKFADRVPEDPDSEEYYFDEGDVLKFLVDAMNAAKINISMINHDHERAIEYRGQRDKFSMGLTSLNDPVSSVIEGMGEISYILNDREEIESWTSYRNGKHTLHILRTPDAVSTAIEEMTQTEIHEAEDNVEATQ